MNGPLRILIIALVFLASAAQGLAGAHVYAFCFDDCCKPAGVKSPAADVEPISCCGSSSTEAPAAPAPARPCLPERSGCACVTVPAGPAVARADQASRRAPEHAEAKPLPPRADLPPTPRGDEPGRSAYRSFALGRASPVEALRTIRLLI